MIIEIFNDYRNMSFYYNKEKKWKWRIIKGPFV